MKTFSFLSLTAVNNFESKTAVGVHVQRVLLKLPIGREEGMQHESSFKKFFVSRGIMSLSYYSVGFV